MEEHNSKVGLSNKDKIDILLKEYETLRREIENRTNNRFTLLGICIGLLSFIAATQQLQLLTWWIISGIVLFIITVWWWLGWLILFCARRVLEIELKVNAFAGEELLHWEAANITSRRIFHIFYR